MRRVAGAFLLGLLAAPGAAAGTSRSWSVGTAAEFAAGTLEGTALDGRGHVTLAPRLVDLWGPDEGIVWAVATDGGDGAFVAVSSPTRLLHVGPGRAPVAWHATGDETLVAAILADGQGGLYFGLSPAGQVLHARGPAEPRVVAEAGALFVWALAAAPDGSLWIGTGFPGRLLRVDPEGRMHAVFEAGDDPVRCLAPLGSGGVVLGTGGRGRVIRVDDRGRPFVLFDADEAEVVGLDVLEDGTVLALTARAAKQAGAARAASAAAAQETVRVTASAPEPEGNEGTTEAEPGEAPARRRPAVRFETPPGGALYRIAPDGDARSLWQSPGEIPFGLARYDASSWLVATGDAGRIHHVGEDGRAAVLVELPSDQASALGRGPRGAILTGGTTDARVALVVPEPRERGSYISAAHDAGTVADWGRLRWEGERPAGSAVRASVRGGNTEEPDETWTDWAPLHGDPAAGLVTALPPTRWIQARLDLEPGRGGASPRVRLLTLFYRPRNRRPVIEELTVHPAGVIWTPGPSQGARPTGPLVVTDPISRRAESELVGSVVPQSIRRSYEHGGRTVTWQAADPDGDALTYSVAIRREGSADVWIPLASSVENGFLSWDTRGLPDGLYRVRVEAGDARDNPEGRHLEATRESGPFRIDHTRPVVGAPRIGAIEGGLRVEFAATDAGGNVVAAEFALDAGEWKPLDPFDGVADSEEERYEIVVPPPGGGIPRMLKVRVTDGAGNTGGEVWALEPGAVR